MADCPCCPQSPIKFMTRAFCRSCGNANCYPDPFVCAMARIIEMNEELDELVEENDRLVRELTARGLGWVVHNPKGF